MKRFLILISFMIATVFCSGQSIGDTTYRRTVIDNFMKLANETLVSLGKDTVNTVYEAWEEGSYLHIINNLSIPDRKIIEEEFDRGHMIAIGIDPD